MGSCLLERQLIVKLETKKGFLGVHMHIVFSTGAGISAPSGLGTYRGPDGLWTLHPELEAISTGKNYAKNREKMEPYWDEFRQKCLCAKPNEAHLAIAKLQCYNPHKVDIITQNVDGLHHAAWIAEYPIFNDQFDVGLKHIYMLHGNIHENRCLASMTKGKGCSNKEPWDYVFGVDGDGDPSKCPKCGGPSRPNVVFFGEGLPKPAFSKAQGACLQANVFIAVGTSGQVVPACDLVQIAKAAGARTILINAEPWEYPHPDFDETYIGDCVEILPEVIAKL